MFGLVRNRRSLWPVVLVAAALGVGAAVGRAQSSAGKAELSMMRGAQPQAEAGMASYMVLFHFTQQGIDNIRESPARIERAKVVFGDLGARVMGFYAAKGGPFDTVFFVEAPNDETVARAAFAVEALGNVRTEVVRVFTEEEFRRIAAALP